MPCIVMACTVVACIVMAQKFFNLLFGAGCFGSMDKQRGEKILDDGDDPERATKRRAQLAQYIVMAYIVMHCLGVACVVMAYLVMSYSAVPI